MLNKGKKCCIHGDGSHTRRYIYGTDVADAISLIIHKGIDGEIYNIGTPFEISNLELARLLAKEMKLPGDVDSHIEFVGDRQFNDRRYAIDSMKLEKLGWAPKVAFDDGIKKTIQWYKNHGEEFWGSIEHLMTPFPHKR
jgi:dTDP-glucose 4,6-dehydratase